MMLLQPAFLEALSAMQLDLAITAAYGNMLPTAFLNIPKHGTINIHPSLLPKYRGAAPVQRAVQVWEQDTNLYRVALCKDTHSARNMIPWLSHLLAPSGLPTGHTL
eukprot:GHRR01036320.1.p1 GENE.GHRR01036320.1~~GHRR01036320.1.p1  ORF type:complete len:106 (-),score=32.52 GHRR01036320.1:153-470(-)